MKVIYRFESAEELLNAFSGELLPKSIYLVFSSNMKGVWLAGERSADFSIEDIGVSNIIQALLEKNGIKAEML